MSWQQLLRCVSAVVLCVLTCAAQDAGANARISSTDAAVTGAVSDEAGVGLAGAMVMLQNGSGFSRNMSTDSQGLYAITSVPAGVCSISVTVHGSKILEASLVLSPAQVLTFSIAGGLPDNSQPKKTTDETAFTGTISDQAGTGVEGAVITLDKDTPSAQAVTADTQGVYALTRVHAGSHTISVSAHGVMVFQAKAVLSPGQVATLSIAGPLVAQATPQTVASSPISSSNPSSTAASFPKAASGPGIAPAPSTSTPQRSASSPAFAAVPPNVPPAPAASTVSAGPPSQLPAPPSNPAPQPSSKGPVSISGTVNDQTGAVVVNATINVSQGSNIVKTVTSDEKGNYALVGLAPGSYNVTASAPGFKKFEADNLSVTAGQPIPMDIGLEPAGEKTEVTVQGQNVGQVETESAQVSGTITEKEVLNLGLNGRNFTQLIALTPGVSNQTGQDEAKVGVTGSVKYSVNGGRVEYNTFEVDGSDVLNAGLNGAESTLMVYPSLDAIQEVKVLTSNYGAMYGRTASGTVQVTTKSGGANWHGNAYEFLRNEAFNARNYFDQTLKAPLYRRNDFGFTIGGPLSIPHFYNSKKDKTFVFWSEEFRLEKSPSDLYPDFNEAVPSLAERQGDFSDVCPPQGTGYFYRSAWPDCPSAGTTSTHAGALIPFPNNDITVSPLTPGALNPFSTIDTNARALLALNLIPLPNSNTGCNSTIGSCYDSVISEPTHWREELGRLDENITTKLRASFRYIHDSWDTITPVPQWSYLHQVNIVNSFPTVQNKFVGPGINLVAQLSQTISARALNSFTASYANSHITLTDVNGSGGATFQRPAGFATPACTPATGVANPTVDCTMGALFDNGFGGKAPGLIIGGNNEEYGGNGFAVDPSYMPWEHTNPIFSYRDDVTLALGTHTLQFGGQLVFTDKNETNDAVGAITGDVQGLLRFSNINAAGVLNTGNAFANFLILWSNGGGVNSIQSYSQDSAQLRYYNRYWIAEPYVQDDWKLNQRITLNLGMRFSLFGLYHEKYLREYNFVPSAYSPTLASELTVNPQTGQLISLPDLNPIPISLTNPDPRIVNGLVQCGVDNVPAGCMTNHVFNPAPRVGFAWDPKGDGKTSIRGGYGIFYEHGTGQEANSGSLEGSAPLVLSMTQPFPESYGCINGSAGTGGNCSTFGDLPGAFPLNITSIPTKAVWPYAQQWSLSVQRELPQYLVASVAYVGSKGTHLTIERELNQIKPLPANLNPFGQNEPIIPQSPFNASAGDCAGFQPPTNNNGGIGYFTLLNGTTVRTQNPAYINLEAACTGENITPNQNPPVVNTLRPYPGFGDILSLQNVADSSYHSFQFTLRRVKGPLTVGSSYSYSHSIDDSSDRSDSTFVNSYDLRSNRASSNYDQRHLLNVSYIYALPNLASPLYNLTQGRAGGFTGNGEDTPPPVAASKLLRMLGDGWQISGITVVQSGTPFSVINGGSATVSVLDNAGVANGAGAGSYPDIVRRPAPFGRQFNPQSFGPLFGNPNMFVAPRGLTFGDAGRNFLNNPRRTNFDMTLLKHFKAGESGQIEFRAEAFNIFNHTQFRLYNPDLGNTGSNVISCYGGPSYSAGYSAPLNPVTGASTGTDCVTGDAFLHPVDAHRPRTVQLALEYQF